MNWRSLKLGNLSISALTPLVLLYTLPVFADWYSGSLPPPPPEPEGKCVSNCGEDTPRSSQPSGPSPEQLKREWEEKDLREAADDADDKGVAAYNRGDWASAIKYFNEALEYEPDDQVFRDNLHKAQQKQRDAEVARQQQKIRDSEALRQLESVQYHSNKAALPANSKEAQKGFDTGGKNVGTVDAGGTVHAGNYGSKEPVVPTSRRTQAITNLEHKREASKAQFSSLEKKLQALDPKKDAVEISKVKQEKTNVERKIQHFNFSITEELRKPPAADASKAAK